LLPKYIKFIFRDIFPSVFAHVNAGLWNVQLDNY
jgi:hypothetical protein